MIVAEVGLIIVRIRHKIQLHQKRDYLNAHSIKRVTVVQEDVTNLLYFEEKSEKEFFFAGNRIRIFFVEGSTLTNPSSRFPVLNFIVN